MTCSCGVLICYVCRKVLQFVDPVLDIVHVVWCDAMLLPRHNAVAHSFHLTMSNLFHQDFQFTVFSTLYVLI